MADINNLPDSPVPEVTTAHADDHAEIHAVLEGRKSPSANLDMGTHTVLVPTPTAATHAANKAYVDSEISGSGSVPAVTSAGQRFTTNDTPSIKTVNEVLWAQAFATPSVTAAWGLGTVDESIAVQAAIDHATGGTQARPAIVMMGPGIHCFGLSGAGTAKPQTGTYGVEILNGEIKLYGIRAGGNTEERQSEIVYAGPDGGAVVNIPYVSGTNSLQGPTILKDLIIRAVKTGGSTRADYCIDTSMKCDLMQPFTDGVQVQNAAVNGIRMTAQAHNDLVFRDLRTDGHYGYHLSIVSAHSIRFEGSWYVENKSGSNSYGKGYLYMPWVNDSQANLCPIVFDGGLAEIGTHANFPYLTATGAEGFRLVHIDTAETSLDRVPNFSVTINNMAMWGGTSALEGDGSLQSGILDITDPSSVMGVVLRLNNVRKDKQTATAGMAYGIRVNGTVLDTCYATANKGRYIDSWRYDYGAVANTDFVRE